MAKRVAVLNSNQFTNFQTNGQIPEFFINDKQVPAYAFEGMKRKFGTTYEWKLFPKEVGKEDLLYLYERCGLATNAVDCVPQRVWSKGFTIKVTNEKGEEVKDSPLEKKIWEINQDHNVRRVFQEAHCYARIFGLGIVVMGLADNQKLETEVQKPSDLSYLTSFSGDEISEIIFDEDLSSDTYGQISKYKVTIKGEKQVDIWIHASRVIHVMEKTIGKSSWGKSILEPAYDLFTIYKNSVWSAGESYYQNASPLFVVSWDIEELGEPPSDAELDDIKSDIEELHVRKRYVKPKGFNLEVVPGTGQLPDPQKILDPIVELIAGAVKVPKQLLLGTEAGALASGEVNLEQYYSQIADVQSTFAEPLLVEFYGRLQKWGILPEGDFDIEWTPLWEMDEHERADIDYLKMRTASLALGDPMRGIPALMGVPEAREQTLGLNPEIGAGRLPTMKTEAATQEAHKAFLDFSVEAMNQGFKQLADKVKYQEVSHETAIESAQELIHSYVDRARKNARRRLEVKLGQAVSELPKEQMQWLENWEREYLRDFVNIINDIQVETREMKTESTKTPEIRFIQPPEVTVKPEIKIIQQKPRKQHVKKKVTDQEGRVYQEESVIEESD